MAMLPGKSRLFTAVNPALAWDEGEYILADIADAVHLLLWAQTKDASKGRNKPERLARPGDKKAFAQKAPQQKYALPVDEYEKAIKKRRSVQNGN